MKRSTLLIATPIVISFIIRLFILLQTADISYGAYEALVHVQHIIDTGLPMTETALAWGGAITTTMPLFYYVIAFFSLFFSEQLVALILPNVMISLTPIPVYLIATQLTKRKAAIVSVTLASAFAPLLYKETIISTDPIALAIPLFLLTYYYFIRIGRTPREQLPFLVSVIALTLTHPISLLLIPAMGITLLLTYVQKTRFSIAMAEATIFTAFLTIWANIIVYNEILKAFGLKTLMHGTEQTLSVATVATLVGVLPIIGASWAAYHYLAKEKNAGVHAMTALSATIILAMAAQFITFTTGALILSIVLLALSAPAVELILDAKKRSRVPGIHSIGYVIIVLLYLVTAAVPTVALGFQALGDHPETDENDLIETLTEAYPKQTTILWDQEKGYLLMFAGYKTPYNSNMRSHPDSKKITEDMDHTQQAITEIHLIETLNEYGIEAIVLPAGEKDLSERCFPKLETTQTTYEVYTLRCVVQ